jgi:phospholipase C
MPCPAGFFCPNGSNRLSPRPIQCAMSRNRLVQNVTWAATLLVLACWGLSSVAQSLPSTPPSGITKLNHIIFMAQENRSLDHYFGELRQYWADNGYADRSFDGLPQFNPASGLLPHYGPPPSNPGCDPAFPPPKDCTIDSNSPKVASFELITQCTENTSPSWNESHVDFNYSDPLGNHGPKMNGFVYTAAHDGRVDGFFDIKGSRAMGYYDGTDLNYYYFMASNFATSDRWFNPVMARTHPNREYLVAGTSQGDAYPVRGNNFLTATTIFQELQNAGVSWKIYVNPTNTGCSGPPFDPACLLQTTYIKYFQWGQTIPTKYPKNIGTIGIVNSDFENDLQNGTLPAVAQIEPATDAGLDEHPSSSDASPSRTQDGALYVSDIINSVMTSSSWKDSAFILTYDEFGGIFDHVPPHKAVSPDGIKPKDLLSGDICNKGQTGPTCDFTYTGYRVPLLVVSPYTKKHYVSHTVADNTAILKMIETRFQLPPLTKRDAAQMDMTEFFDFAHPSWLTPPTPPLQNTSDACYLNKLP